MSCTQKQQLVCFSKVRVYKPWFRHFNDHKDFRNEGTVHLFSLMALFSYANFRSNERVINGDRYMEAPGQWICKLGALPRILRVHSKAQALELMEYFQNHGFLIFEILDEEKEILRFTIADWKEHCTHLQYNYYSYKGSGFFFFPLPVGRLLLKTARKEVGIVFSELDAIMDMWLHTILNDPQVRGSEYMPVVYYSNMRGMPLLSYTYLARRWGWSKSRVGRFMLKAGEYGIISRVSFSSSRGSVISMCRYYYYCTLHENYNATICPKKAVKQEDVESLALRLIQTQIRAFSDAQRLIANLNATPSSQTRYQIYETQIDDAKRKIEKFNQLKAALYGDFADGLLSHQDYTDLSEDYSRRADDLRIFIAELEKEKEKYSVGFGNKMQWALLIEKYKDQESLDAEMAAAFIETLTLFNDGHVEVAFRHRDEIEQVLYVAATRGKEAERYAG